MNKTLFYICQYLINLVGWQPLDYFFQTLHITQKSGLTLLEGFEYVLKTLKNPVYHHVVYSIY